MTLFQPVPTPLLSGLTTILLWAGFSFLPGSAGSETVDRYQLPPQDLVNLVDAPLTPTLSISPDQQWMLITERHTLPGIADLAARELRLAGLRINPATNGRSRQSFTGSKLRIRDMNTLEEREVTGLPPGAKIAYATWSPDSKTIAFTLTDEANIELWVTEVAKDRTRRVIRQRLNAARTRPFYWLSDSRTLVAAIVPEDRGPEPAAPAVPAGPIIQEHKGGKAPARTYQDLLKNEHDKDMLDHYLAAQLMRVDVNGGKRKRIGEPVVLHSFSPSPDGNYLMVQSLHRPYSYLVPYSRFPKKIEIWDLDGKIVHLVADLPLKENVPTSFGSVPTGPRSLGWRSDADATLYWVEAQDGGDARAEAEIRDKVYFQAAPFKKDPLELASLPQRYWSVEWGSNDVAVVHAWWWKTRNVKTWIINPGNPAAEPRLVFDYSWQDKYNDPGSFMSRSNKRGRDVLLMDPRAKSLYLTGEGASPEGNRPFLDRLDMATLETSRLWRSEAPYYEEPYDLLGRDGSRVITRRESLEQPPNYFVRTVDTGDLRQITDFPHPHPDLSGIEKELVKYERADGVQLTGTLYLPPGYKKEDGPLSLLMWAYPEEFKSADDAGQVDDSPYRFDRIGWWSPLAWLTQGYAVLDDPSLPIIGEGEVESNDTFVAQLVAGAEAAVDFVVERGITDRDHIAIGGHSYGAFMTANLLAHSDLFRTGVARSGAYNRTLTPFGFQAEERTLWESPEVYFEMSPFMHAEKVNEPILLIHGEADNNSGTYPMQSERYFNALKGLGAQTRLVMLPHESHGYRARESVLHVLWETNTWLENHLKNAEPRKDDSDQGPTSSSSSH